MLLGRKETFGMAKLACLRLLVAETESQREPACECPPTQVEHARALDAAVADQRHVRRATTDIDEDAALRPGFLARACSGEGVWLSDGAGQLEVELTHNRVDGVDVRHRREGVEHGDLEVLAC